jgi:chromosome segregation and condensation protein ScpB
MSSVAEEHRIRLREFDQQVLAVYAVDKTLTNTKLAERLGCGYDEIVRSLRRSRVVRKVGRPKKEASRG